MEQRTRTAHPAHRAPGTFTMRNVKPYAQHTDTRNDTRLFDPDPLVNNRTFNGRDDDQYILFEDYDNDNRDDTPEDVHYEAGMGCIDCHGSYDLHGGNAATGQSSIMSRMEQSVAIACESCHGGIEAYAATVTLLSGTGTRVEEFPRTTAHPQSSPAMPA